MKFCLFDAYFLVIYKKIKWVSLSQRSSLSAQILTTLINAVCLNSSNDVYDSDTAVLHWIISKSDEVNVQF